MHLRSLVAGLTLLGIAWAAPAAGGSAQTLDSATFSERTRTGTWVIKHFSPKCKHCRSFQPKWEQAVAALDDVQFGEINCAQNEQLCDTHNVEAWPTVSVFKHGQQQKRLLVGDQTKEALLQYIAETAQRPAVAVLGAGNFTEHAGKGVWLVKHYSPFCPHCRHMAPHWAKAADEAAAELGEAGVLLGEVNCIDNRRLCEDNFVDGYPTVNLFVDGRFVEEMLVKYEFAPMKEYMLKLPGRVKSGELAAKKAVPVVANDNRDWDDAADAADKAQESGPAEKLETDGARDAEPKSEVSKANEPKPAETKANEPKAEVSKADGEPKQPEESYNPDGEVITLTKENFAERTASGPWFIKFYAPWCPHCQHLAPEWTRLGASARGRINIGEVNCDEAGQLCAAQNVQGYPTLRMLWAGESAVYKGPRELDNMLSFVDSMLAQPRAISDAEQLQTLQEQSDVVFVFHGDAGGATARAVTAAMRKMFLAGRLGIVKDAGVAQALLGAKVAAPALAAIKDGRVVTYAGALSDADALREWLYAERFPLLPEFTRENADSLFYDSDYLVLGIMATDQGRESLDATREHVRDAAMQYQQWADKQGASPAAVRFAWIDGSKWTSYVNSVFRVPAAEWPAVVIVRPSEDQFFTHDIRGKKIEVSAMSVFLAVRAAVDGRLRAQSTRSIFVRAAKVVAQAVVHVWSLFFGSLIRAAISLAVLALLVYAGLRRASGTRSRRSSFTLVKAD
ncbi:hypothetical protein IWW55_000612 [Coemansia sp. RSA 2706]|nr:hypothetical protein IWW55_000612 [Coemansia sp. RSA 2706]KAJ2314365.1 hypothetical protein IWW54_000964 [Coemansia sp. RSA 2705]